MKGMYGVLDTHYSIFSSSGHNALTVPHSACVLGFKLTLPVLQGCSVGPKLSHLFVPLPWS